MCLLHGEFVVSEVWENLRKLRPATIEYLSETIRET